MGFIRKIFYMLTVLTVLCVGTLVGLAFYALEYSDTAGPLQAQKNIVFKRGESFQVIADELAKQGVITQPLVFKALAVVLGQYHKFKAGEYSFPAAVTPHAVMDLIAEGKVVVHKITIPEGLTARDITKLLAAEPVLEGEVPSIAEGSVLPDTYQFMYGDKRRDVVNHMQAMMKTTLAALWQNRQSGLPFETPQQALTLASIVEKETGVPQERGHVASVFINRLHQGMKLQTDPTVAYGIEQVMGAPLGRPLTGEDLHTPTPYNTYIISGLPPTPIANPGRAALEAVLNPPDTKDIYFVATGVGGHNFAATLEEHNHNVQAYRQRMER